MTRPCRVSRKRFGFQGVVDIPSLDVSVRLYRLVIVEYVLWVSVFRGLFCLAVGFVWGSCFDACTVVDAAWRRRLAVAGSDAAACSRRMAFGRHREEIFWLN